MNRERVALYKFASLPTIDFVKIASKLNLIEQSDRELNELDRLKIAFNRAIERGQIDQLEQLLGIEEMTRKPVLEWEFYDHSDGENAWIEEKINSRTLWLCVEPSSERDFYTSYVNNVKIGEFLDKNEAKIACEDHLETILEPIAKLYEILKKNREC